MSCIFIRSKTFQTTRVLLYQLRVEGGVVIWYVCRAHTITFTCNICNLETQLSIHLSLFPFSLIVSLILAWIKCLKSNEIHITFMLSLFTYFHTQTHKHSQTATRIWLVSPPPRILFLQFHSFYIHTMHTYTILGRSQALPQQPRQVSRRVIKPNSQVSQHSNLFLSSSPLLSLSLSLPLIRPTSSFVGIKGNDSRNSR